MDTMVLIQLALVGLKSLVELIFKLKEVAKQNAELTPEQEAVLDQQIDEMLKQVWWQVGDDGK